MNNTIEVKITGSSVEAENAMRRVATVTQEAMGQLRTNMANLRADFNKGFDVKDENLNVSMAEAKRLFDSTRTATERYQNTLRGLSSMLRNGAIDEEVFNRAVANAKRELDQASHAVSNHGNVVQRAMGAVKGLIGAYVGFQSAGAVLSIASDFEQLELRMNSVMGGQERGKQAFSWIKQFAKDTPFEVDQVSSAFMRLKAFGLDPMDGSMQAISDQSAKLGGGQQTLERISLALGQAWAKQKLQGEEILQLVDAGVPVWDMLAQVTGKTGAEIQKMSEKGQIGRDVIKQLINEMGKQNAGAAGGQMDSWAGKVSNFSDKIKSIIDDVRKSTGFLKLMGGTLGFVTEHLETLSIVVASVGGAMAINLIPMTMAAEGGLLGMARGAAVATKELIVMSLTNPYTAALMAIGVTIAALYSYRDTIVEVNGEQTTLGQVASDVWEGIKTTISEAMNEVGDIVLSVTNSIGGNFGSVGEIWNSITGWLKKNGIDAADVIYWALGIKAVDNIISGFRTMYNVCAGLLAALSQMATQAIANVQNAAQQLSSLNFSGAMSALNDTSLMKSAYDSKQGDTSHTIENKLREGQRKAQMHRISEGLSKGYIENGSNGQKQSGTAHGTGGAAHGGAGGGKKGRGGGKGGGKEESHMSDYQQALDAQKRAFELANDLRELSKDDELAFWNAKLAIVKKGSKDEESVKKKIADVTYEREKQTLKNRLDVAELGREYGHKVDLQKLEDTLEYARYLKEQNQISADDLIEIERNAEDKKYQILLKAIEERKALLEKDPTKNTVELAKITQETEQLWREHQKRMTAIDREQTAESQKRWSGVTSAMDGLWDKGFDAMLNRTLTWKNAMRTIFADLGKAFAKMGFDMLKNWALVSVRKLIMSRTSAAQEQAIDALTQRKKQGGIFATLATFISTKLQELGLFTSTEGTKQVIEASSAAMSATTTAGKAAMQIGANAVVAGSGAAASQASIPYIGPILAIAAMGAMMASVMGMKSKVPSARGGYAIPRGVNPLTQLHEEEMVLPKAQANVINRLANQSGGGSGGGGDNIYHIAPVYHDHTGTLSPENIRRNGRILADEVMRQTRNFKIKKA